MSTLSVTSSASDGRVFRTSQPSWTAARDSADGTSVNTASNIDTKVTYAAGPSYGCFRSFMFFDTSSIPDGATIDSVTLSIFTGLLQAYSTTPLTLQAGTQADTLTVADFDSFTGSEIANRVTFDPNTSPGTQFTFTFNASGRSIINKTGVTKICMRSGYDYDNTDPATLGVGTYGGGIASGEFATPEYRPVLTVNYTVSSDYQLVVQEASLEETVDSPAVSQLHFLSADDALMSMLADVVELVYEPPVTTEEPDGCSAVLIYLLLGL